MTDYRSPQIRAERALRGYTELLDAADWLKREVRVPLESFEITLAEFRLLDVLYREGALPVVELARRRGSEWHHVCDMIQQLEGRGWLRRTKVRLPPVDFKSAHLPKSRREEKRPGRRLTVVGMTAEGKKFLGYVLSIHGKLVTAMMRALDAREMDSLFRICRKLREGNPARFFRELRNEDAE
ncbi:MAG TPA: MarR family transcriptional regulator [Candidatus Acidoferrales bacterium]|jgi:DNA-binding MarR family transcriptional regulator|nr:MarR family transcriptional regulator [Candidatus Acidoferrales bacterium]